MITAKWYIAIQKGCPPRAKLFWQSAIAISVALYLALTAELPAQTTMIVPFFKQVAIPLGVAGFVALAYFVIVGTSNAVNLTDGLDGLAIMPTVMISSALAIFAYVAGHAVFAKYLGIPAHPASGRAWLFFVVRWRARDSPFSGSTPIRRKYSWAMSARLRLARRSAS